MSVLISLTTDDLNQLAVDIRSGRLAPPFNPLALRRYVCESAAAPVAAELNQLAQDGMQPRHLAACIETLRLDRAQRRAAEDMIDLVWIGPEAPGIVNRDTRVVVRELFQGARDSVLIAGYAVYQGHVIFKELAERMDQSPRLDVQMYLDIHRPHLDRSSAVRLGPFFRGTIRSRRVAGAHTSQNLLRPEVARGRPREQGKPPREVHRR